MLLTGVMSATVAVVGDYLGAIVDPRSGSRSFYSNPSGTLSTWERADMRLMAVASLLTSLSLSLQELDAGVDGEVPELPCDGELLRCRD